MGVGDEFMSKYKCIKTLVVDELEDGDHFTGSNFIVEADEIWHLDDMGEMNTIQGREVEMSTKDGSYLHIYEDDLNRHFEALESESNE